jgi:DNA-binding MarR family transcriptional regulator
MSRHPHLDLGAYLPYLLNRVGFAMVAYMTERALDPHHLTIAMWRVLAVLSNKGKQRQVDLSGMTSIDVSTLSRLVTRLVHMGFVLRARSKTNSREVVVELSEKGREVVDRLIPVAKTLERTAIGGVPAKDLAVVKRSLHRIYANMAEAEKSGRARSARSPARLWD